MRQRVCIAVALACGPKLLFADEPTTALDVTVQAQVLDLIAKQQAERFMAMVLVTHDLGVVAGRADEIAVMYAGRIVERAPTNVLFADMKMPYSEALLARSRSSTSTATPASRRSRAGPPTSCTRRPAASSRPAARTCRTDASTRSHRSAAGVDAGPRVPLLVPGRDARRARRRSQRNEREGRVPQAAVGARRQPTDGRQRDRPPPRRATRRCCASRTSSSSSRSGTPASGSTPCRT